MLSILVKSLKYHDPCSIFIIFVPEILKCTTFRHTQTHTHQKKKKTLTELDGRKKWNMYCILILNCDSMLQVMLSI